VASDGTTETLNARGYRGKLPELTRRKGEYRIFMFGASTVKTGAPPITELLQRRFAQAGYPNVEVFNFGVTSTTSGEDLARIVFDGAEYPADLILMYGGGSDLLDHECADPRPGYPYNFIAYENNLLMRDVSSYPWLAATLFGSNLARSSMAGYVSRELLDLNAARALVHWRTDEWIDDIARIYVSRVTTASKVARGLGADFLAVLHPMRDFRERWVADEGKQVEQCPDGAPVVVEQTRIEAHKWHRNALRYLREANGVEWLDLGDLFSQSAKREFEDPVHPTQQALTMVVEAVFRGLMERHKNALDQSALR
jgi:lysophospholipase L1-like esterase